MLKKTQFNMDNKQEEMAFIKINEVFFIEKKNEQFLFTIMFKKNV